MQTIERMQIKTSGTPDETRTFEKGKVELYKLGSSTLGKATFEPGWKWSECVKPIAKTDSCECGHVGYQISGTMHVKSDDGREYDIKAGDSFFIPPGHDGWVVGSEPVVCLDFQGMVEYAKPSGESVQNRVERQQRKH